MRFVTDTHCLFWYFQDSKRLSPASQELFENQNQPGHIVIPTIVLAELLYLSRKYPLPVSFEKTLKFVQEEKGYEICPLSDEIIGQAIPLTDLEIHDALIVATARHLNLPLMTQDIQIVNSGLIQTLRP